MNDRRLLGRLRMLGATSLAIVAAVTVTAAGASAAIASGQLHHAATATPGRVAHPVATTKPTIVLVHGAFADASWFSAEISRLEASGYPVIAPADPLRGLTSDSDYIRSILWSSPRDERVSPL